MILLPNKKLRLCNFQTQLMLSFKFFKYDKTSKYFGVFNLSCKLYDTFKTSLYFLSMYKKSFSKLRTKLF